MNIQQYLETIITDLGFLDKASVIQSLKILWYLKEGTNKEEAEKQLIEIQKEIKRNITGINIEFKLVDEIEIVKEEIIYDEFKPPG